MLRDSFIYEMLFVQVEYVCMEKEQGKAYQEAIEEYRAAVHARLQKSGHVNHNAHLPRRQISNYFVQFRKVLNIISSMYI